MQKYVKIDVINFAFISKFYNKIDFFYGRKIDVKYTVPQYLNISIKQPGLVILQPNNLILKQKKRRLLSLLFNISIIL